LSVDRCQYSRRDPTLVVPLFDSEEAMRTLILSMFVPVATTAVSSVYLCWRFCEVGSGGRSRKGRKKVDDNDGGDSDGNNSR
jgi:hypothetical protein